MPAARLDHTFAALADPTRRAILARLASGDATVNELAEPFRISQPAISRHVRVLRQAGLVTQRRVGRERPCHLRAEPLKQAAGWVLEYRRFWEESFTKLDAVLDDLKRKEKSDVR